MREPEEIMVGNKTLAEILENYLHWWNEDVDGWEDMRANLSEANLSEAENVPVIPMACPDTGSFTGWKKCRDDRIVELEILDDARRSSATGRKCRCDKAIVKSIKSIDGKEECTEAFRMPSP